MWGWRTETVAEPIAIKWITRPNMPEVLRIERLCFAEPWTEDDFIAALRRRNGIGILAARGEQLLGYAIYELHPHHIELLNLAVDPRERFCGAGRAILDKLTSKLSERVRSRVVAVVRESNLGAHLFFRSCGFRAIGIEARPFADCDEDGYVFAYRYKPEPMAGNRISQWVG